MDKRLQKRHKRQVERAKSRVKVSEPDLRTPEEIQAARERSGAADVKNPAFGAQKSPAFRGGPARVTTSASKTDTSG